MCSTQTRFGGSACFAMRRSHAPGADPMKTSAVCFAQLRQLLHDLGFNETHSDTYWRFEHPESGTIFVFRAYTATSTSPCRTLPRRVSISTGVACCPPMSSTVRWRKRPPEAAVLERLRWPPIAPRRRNPPASRWWSNCPVTAYRPSCPPWGRHVPRVDTVTAPRVAQHPGDPLRAATFGRRTISAGLAGSAACGRSVPTSCGRIPLVKAGELGNLYGIGGTEWRPCFGGQLRWHHPCRTRARTCSRATWMIT
jgi:hypothetical protein